MASCQSSQLSKEPRFRLGDRAPVVQQDSPLDDANQSPNRPPQQDEESDVEVHEDEARHEVNEPNPERADLELEVAEPKAASGARLHMSDNQADDSRDDGKKAQCVQSIDDEGVASVISRAGLLNGTFGGVGHLGRSRVDSVALRALLALLSLD